MTDNKSSPRDEDEKYFHFKDSRYGALKAVERSEANECFHRRKDPIPNATQDLIRNGQSPLL